MLVKKLYLENFLSYNNLFVEFGEGLNVFVGQNAAGKTNLAEGVYYAAVGKSARGLKDKELICWESDGGARIRLMVQKRYAHHTIDLRIDPQGKKRITIDELPISRMGELMGGVNIVYFSPDEMRLIKESPADRRRFMDISLCQQDKLYFYRLTEYNKLLTQRNKLLKNYKQSPSLRQMSDLIVEKMMDAEMFIMRKRRDFLTQISPLANARHLFITGNNETLDIAYETEKVDFNDLSSSLQRLYEDSFDKDCRLEYTTVGVHRDDLKITAGDIDVRKYGSQGQQRTSTLSLKLAETDLFTKTVGETPVLILDDVLSELDAYRQKALFDSLGKIQTFVTCTAFHPSLAKGEVFEIIDRGIKKKGN